LRYAETAEYRYYLDDITKNITLNEQSDNKKV